MNKCNSNTLHQILHICGIYKQGTRYLSVELRFGKDRLTQGLERNKNEESFFLLKNNNKKNYSIIVRVNTTIEKDRLNYKKEMRMLLAETAQNLKYYSSSE
jgi:hypothetical protein